MTRLVDAMITNLVKNRNAKQMKKKGSQDVVMTAEKAMSMIQSNATDKNKMELLLNMSNHRKRVLLEHDLSL